MLKKVLDTIKNLIKNTIIDYNTFYFNDFYFD